MLVVNQLAECLCKIHTFTYLRRNIIDHGVRAIVSTGLILITVLVDRG